MEKENAQLKQRISLLQNHFNDMSKMIEDRFNWLELRLGKKEKVEMT